MQPARAQIGPYAIENVLGRGGMGIVYRGVHQQSGSVAAIKTVRVTEAGWLSLIRREVQSLARLHHPGVVRVFEHGVDGIPWYAMELLEGSTLSDRVRGAFRNIALQSDSTPTSATLGSGALSFTEAETLPPQSVPTPLGEPARPPVGVAGQAAAKPPAGGGRLDELLGIASALCETLAYVHGEGVVHRDLKPSNVFVTPSGKPVLVDFGLATRVNDPTGRDVIDSDVYTGGSARYMAPEQIRSEPLDPRSDLYSLGCLLFELIAGRTPFIGSLHEVIDQHLRRPPPRLDAFVEGVSVELERLVASLLKKDRRERVGYARDVLNSLAMYAVSPWSGTLPRAKTYLYRPPLVGRQGAVKDAERLLRSAIDGHGQLALVLGESGIGKTRFALELAQLTVHSDIRVITSACSPLSAHADAAEGGRVAPLEPLKPFLRAVADACVESGEHETRRLLGSAGPVLATFEPALPQPAGERAPAQQLPVQAAREQLYRSLLEVLAAYAAGSPLLIVIDDLQWADELTLGLLQLLARGALRDLPVLVVGLARREELGPELQRICETDGVPRIELGRLRAEDISRMICGMLSLDQAAPEFVDFLSDKSEGNAFFVAEYLRIAVAEQVLVRNELGRWTLADSSEPTAVLCESLPLPHSLREVVERRLAGLSERSRSVMLLAATLGRNFDLVVLQYAASVDEVGVLDAIADLVQRHVVEPVEQGGGFRFTHDKLREVPYTKLSSLERAQCHEHVARALESHRAQGGEVEAATLGHHWLEAGDDARAVPHLKAAGDHAAQLNALDQATAHYTAAEHALESLGRQGDDALTSLREALGDVLLLTGALESARAAFGRALSALAAAPVDRARIHRKLGKAWEIAHQHDHALAAYDRAEAELARSADPDSAAHKSEWLRVQINRMWVYYWLARVPDMDAIVAKVGAMIDEQAPFSERAEYYQALARRDYRDQRYAVSETTLGYIRRSLEASERANMPLQAAFARFDLGFGLLFNGQLAPAEAELTRARAVTRRLGDATSEIRCCAYLTLTQRRLGRVEETLELARETLERATRVQMLDYVALARACQGWVAWKRGQLEDAQQLSQAALDGWAALSFPHPFQWNGVLTLLAIQLPRVPLRNSIALARRLLDRRQAKLPDGIDGELQSACDAYEAGGRPSALEALERALTAARALGYL